MLFIETTPVAEAAGDVESMYRRQQSAFGYVPSYARAFSHRPELMTLWAELQRGIRKHVEPRRFELVTLVAAHALRSSSCSLAHGRMLTEFFSAEEVCAIVRDADPSPLTAAERDMVRYARKVVVDASAVTAADVTALKAHGFGDAEIFDIAATAAARAFFTKVLDGVGAAPDSAFLKLEPALREALTVGREIDTRDVERLA